MTPHLLFLPGAGGSADFWQPLADLLPQAWRKTRLNWPGLGHEAHRPGFDSLDALTAHAAAHLAEGPNIVLAQSMGGIVAMRLALQQPGRVAGLVLTAASGGIDLARFGVADWRPAYRAEYPGAATWIERVRADHAADLPGIRPPALLLWGDADAVSPPAVGRYLASLLPAATLHVLPGGDHGFAQTQAATIRPLVQDFIARIAA